jgi:hypothetical protein
LHVGEFLMSAHAPGPASGTKRLHPNSWTLSGVLRLAFGRLGGTTSKKTRVSSRSLDACALVSHAFEDRQEEEVRKMSMTLEVREERSPWTWVARRWDETPIEVRFDALLDLARPLATYWWRDPEAQPAQVQAQARQQRQHHGWQRLSYAE